MSHNATGQVLASLLVGLVFGAGLGVSGMTQADKVINFLDLTDAWDPSLALVMGGAIGIHLLLFKVILRRPTPILGSHFGIPTRTDVDGRLVGGAALFGVGWAVGGYCPGPGLVSMASGAGNALVFVGTMVVGMMLFHAAEEALRGYRAASEPIRQGSASPDEVDSPGLSVVDSSAMAR